MFAAKNSQDTFISSIVIHSPGQRWFRSWLPPPCGMKLKGLPSQRRNRSGRNRSEEHTSELQSLMRISYAVFCLKKKNTHTDMKYNISCKEDSNKSVSNNEQVSKK